MWFWSAPSVVEAINLASTSFPFEPPTQTNSVPSCPSSPAEALSPIPVVLIASTSRSVSHWKPKLVSESQAVEGMRFGIEGLARGFWTMISDSLSFIELNVKADAPLLVSFLSVASTLRVLMSALVGIELDRGHRCGRNPRSKREQGLVSSKITCRCG